MNFLRLRAFYTVAKEGSFIKAAKKLFLSQPCLSKQVQALEADLGVPLLKRHSRGVYLTEAGEALYRYAERIFSLLQEAEETVCAYRGLEKGQLAIGASPTVGAYILPPILYAFHRIYPNLYLRAVVDTTPRVLERILTNELNLGLVEGELTKTDGIKVIGFMGEEELVVIVSPQHPWHKRKEVTAEELAQANFINREIGSKTRELYERALAEKDITLNSVVEFSSPEAIKNYVKVGLGVAIVSRSLVKEDVEKGLLHALRIRDLHLKRVIKLVHRTGRNMCPAGKAFVKFLQSFMKTSSCSLQDVP